MALSELSDGAIKQLRANPSLLRNASVIRINRKRYASDYAEIFYLLSRSKESFLSVRDSRKNVPRKVFFLSTIKIIKQFSNKTYKWGLEALH